MESLFLLIPLSLLLILLLAWILHWSIKSGQFDDLDGPGEAILMDDDLPKPQNVSNHSQK
jgi:cbb3-type cytochrome oxidase maturation protein